MINSHKITIIGGGNLGSSIAKGLIKSKLTTADKITVTNLELSMIQHLKNDDGINISTNNKEAVKNSEIIIIAVKPMVAEAILKDIKNEITKNNKILISVISGCKLNDIEEIVGKIPVIRAMPNTAIAIQESMTALSFNKEALKHKTLVTNIFDHLGSTLIIPENQMPAATVLASCGIAFALRFMRGISQGGVEIGFNSQIAHQIAAQIMKGASKLITENKSHPEQEIDKVTTPMGVTILSLNTMEHGGFSSSMIKGIVAGNKKIQDPEAHK